MRRSICYCEPNSALAGEVNTWQFIYTTAAPLPKGTLLRFDLVNKGRAIDWEVPSTDTKLGSNVIYATLENGKVLNAKTTYAQDAVVPYFTFTLPSQVPAGSTITIAMGSPKDPSEGTRAQCYAQRRKTFQLSVDTTGKGRFEDPEVFTLDVRGNRLHYIRVITPSFVARNKRFDVIIRFEDEFGNLTSNAQEDTLIELSYENLRESLTWKLFVPETGFITLPNLYFNEPGVYTIRLLNTATKEIFRSAPIMCLPDASMQLFWGVLHGESEKIDSTENIESCLRHFRDEKAYNFFASSPFENQTETPNEMWRSISQNIIEFDEADRFTTFSGFQWQGEPGEEGVREILYAKEGKSILRKKDPKYSSLKKIYKLFAPKEIISIPTFTMGKGYEYDFKEFDSEFERVVEIYNAWGSSECLSEEGNPVPIHSTNKKGVKESGEGSVLKGLLKGHRFGFVAGGLDDRGIYSNFFDEGQEQYPPGLTAILASEHSRAALFEALYQRSCYATTGERIILGLFIAGAKMGSELGSDKKPGLLVNRHITGYVAGSDKIKTVEILRNGKVIHTIHPKLYHENFSFDDMSTLSQVAIDAKNKKPPFVFYYVRVTQEDGHMAWSSPIWIDLLPPAPKPIIKKPAKVVKKPLIQEIEIDDEEEDDDLDDDFDDDDFDDDDE